MTIHSKIYSLFSHLELNVITLKILLWENEKKAQSTVSLTNVLIVIAKIT